MGPGYAPIKNQVAMSLGFWAAGSMANPRLVSWLPTARGPARTRQDSCLPSLGAARAHPAQLGAEAETPRTKHRLQGGAQNSLGLPCAGRGTRDEDMCLSWRVTTQAFIYWEFSANQIVRMSPTRAASLARGPISTAELHNLTARTAKTKLGQT